MPKAEFMSLMTLQAAEGQQSQCCQMLKEIFDDPSILQGEFFRASDDPEILLSVQKWPSQGVFDEYMRKVHDHQLFQNSQKIVDFVQITHWTPLDNS